MPKLQKVKAKVKEKVKGKVKDVVKAANVTALTTPPLSLPDADANEVWADIPELNSKGQSESNRTWPQDKLCQPRLFKATDNFSLIF